MTIKYKQLQLHAIEIVKAYHITKNIYDAISLVQPKCPDATKNELITMWVAVDMAQD